MRVLEPFITENLVLEIPYEEVKQMLAKNEDRLNEFANLLHEFDQWQKDVKKIRTKQLLEAADK